jgi:hypothetical protein
MSASRRSRLKTGPDAPVVEPRWMPTDYGLARDLYRQVLELRDLLEAVARELERLANEETNGAVRQALLRRAMRIRARLHEG